MKSLFMLGLMAVISSTTFAQSVSTALASPEPPMIVEASCGKCNFKAKEDECSLYVRMDGKIYPVVGFKIDDLGDAHGEEGMCKAIRKAEVTGVVKGDKFYAQAFKLLPINKDKP